jgi:hypothetical protein
MINAHVSIGKQDGNMAIMWLNTVLKGHKTSLEFLVSYSIMTYYSFQLQSNMRVETYIVYY